MKFDITGARRYVTRDGQRITEIKTHHDFAATIDGVEREFRRDATHVFDTDLDIMTEEEHRAASVPAKLAELTEFQRSIVVALIKDAKLITAIRYLREQMDWTLSLAKNVAYKIRDGL